MYCFVWGFTLGIVLFGCFSWLLENLGCCRFVFACGIYCLLGWWFVCLNLWMFVCVDLLFGLWIYYFCLFVSLLFDFWGVCCMLIYLPCLLDCVSLSLVLNLVGVCYREVICSMLL